jgi:hypothetical protein
MEDYNYSIDNRKERRKKKKVFDKNAGEIFESMIMPEIISKMINSAVMYYFF